MYKDKGRTRARDTTTSINMTVDLDTDPTYEATTEKAVVFITQCLDLGPNGASEVTRVWQKIVYTRAVFCE